MNDPIDLEYTPILTPITRTVRDPFSPPWEACKVCGGDHWTKDHTPEAAQTAIGPCRYCTPRKDALDTPEADVVPERAMTTMAGQLLLMSGLTFHSGRRLADHPELLAAIEAEAVAAERARLAEDGVLMSRQEYDRDKAEAVAARNAEIAEVVRAKPGLICGCHWPDCPRVAAILAIVEGKNA